jgi:hypothetical protein
VAAHAFHTAVHALLDGIAFDLDVFAFGVDKSAARNMTRQAFFRCASGTTREQH